MKRIPLIVAYVAPALALAFFVLWPEADRRLNLPLFHFYIVTFTTFAAAVISILLSAALGPRVQPRHVLAATAFAVMGGIFFSHGLATPGALMDHPHPAVQWSAWLTLFGGSALFAAAALDGPAGLPGWLPVRSAIYFAAGGVLAYSAIAALAPQWLSAVDAYVSPWHRNAIFLVSLALWLFAAWRLWRTWRVSHSRVDGMLAFVAFWLAQATVSLHRYPIWRLSWWTYHLVLLLSFVLTVYVLAAAYEQVRQFRLTRYYLAASLILTAALALVASALFTQFSYHTLVDEATASTRRLADNLASDLVNDLPDLRTAADVQGLGEHPEVSHVMDMRLTGLAISSLTVYDSDGIAVYASQPEWLSTKVGARSHFEAALAGQTLADVHPPEAPPASYTPSGGVHVIATYAPIRSASDGGSSIGVLVTQREAPELMRAAIRARIAGLITAAGTMGLLFLALLSVVHRADVLITARSRELAAAHADLSRSEALRDDLTNMIAHDLRNPLSAISAGVDLLPHVAGKAQAAMRARIIGNVRAASQRMMGLIDDMLTVSKIESGGFKPKFETASVFNLLSEGAQLFAAQAAAENKALTFHSPPDLAADLDRTLIGRVLENLIGNAFKYTDSKIEVSAVADEGRGRMVFSVRDDGPGVPEAYRERIFDKFVQAPDPYSEPARRGTGLGLAFCRLAVELHGGQIWVEDVAGGGSNFTFWLPQAH